MLADGTIPPPTPDDIGHEPTWEGYLDHVVRRDFRALKPVMRPDGVVFVVIDDVIANPASIYDEQTYHPGTRQAEARAHSQVSDPGHHIDAARRAIGWAYRICSPQR